jgi:hypothetical protein
MPAVGLFEDDTNSAGKWIRLSKENNLLNIQKGILKDE